MRCRLVRDCNTTAIICTRGPRRQHCRWCNRWSTKLCDFSTRNGETCDAPLCDTHATRLADRIIDYCPEHMSRIHAAAPSKPKRD